MPTPDFEDWLERQDIPIEETGTLDDYLDYLEEELGIHEGSLDVAAKIYTEKYEYLSQLDIRAIEYHGEIRGVEYVDTRYGIKGYPGLWGRESMLEIARDIAAERDLLDIVDYLDTLIAREGE